MSSNYGIGGNEVKLDAGEAISEIPQNRTLLTSKLTADTPIKPEIVGGLKTVEEVFAHYSPQVKIDFEDQEGTTNKELLNFSNLGDFGAKGITAQSPFLQDLDSAKEQFQKIIKQLKTNKILKTALQDPESKEALLKVMQTLIQELEDAK
ncbi:type VI secretion system contractile sheath small subunit [Xanthovirga aplysinae]|uniref:type VI secretion system contractile sheath small subunit n=1 Tax=Xanthovirga aplysinae TaxID=2529853 RepID=UPI0012BCA790|nr:type VI secretion system contractile sheath small subunit [Xanthovirga aplysinae]